MFKQIEKGMNSLLDLDREFSKIKIDFESKLIAWKYFLRILKRYDPNSCFIQQKDIAHLKKVLLRRYHRSKVLKYLFKLISYVYTSPLENHIIDTQYDFYKHSNMFKDFHK